jgi:hypothetical protein
LSKVYSNAFDDLYSFDPDEAKAQQAQREEKGKRLDYLIHKVFAQTEEGIELFSMWRESLIMTPTAEAGMDNIDIGIREGMKTFIRKIGITLNRVEES